MADNETQQRRRKSLKKFSYRGVDVADLINLSTEEFVPLLHSRGRRKFKSGINAKTQRFMAKLRKAKAEAGPDGKPAPVKTHLRNCMVVPEMIGNIVGVYNGKVFNAVDIRPEMVGKYLGEFSITYKPVKRKNANAKAAFSKMISLK